MPLPPALPPVLEVFYSATCAPCRLELPIVAQLANEHWQLHIVILDDETRAREQLRAAAPLLEQMATVDLGHSPQEVLRTAGDQNGLLPYARMMPGTGEKSCASWAGRLTVSTARRLLAACAAAISAPPPSRF